MTTQYGFFIDSSRCTGCKTCELACKDYKDLTPDVSFRRSPKRVSVLNAASGGPKGERSESNLTCYVYAAVFARCPCPGWLRQ